MHPHTPHNEAGTRIEPLVSEPRLSGTSPAATAAAEPPDEPPAMRAGSCGLRVGVARGGRRVRQHDRAGHGGVARDVEQVLDRERHPGQRTDRLVPVDRVVKNGGLRQRFLLPQTGEAVQQRVMPGHPIQRRFHHR